MNYSSFCDYLFASLLDQLEPETTITKEKILKNNNVHLDAFIIRFPGSSCSPVVYLEPLYREYKNGSSIEKIARMISAKLTEEQPLPFRTLPDTNSPEKIRDHIAFRLISKENNETFLEDVPWIPYLDLAVTFFLHFGYRDDKQITSVIHNHQATSWNLSPADLYEIAKENTPKLFPSVLGRLEHFLLGLDEDASFAYDSVLPPLYLLSNENGVHGAACLLYDDKIKDLADTLESDLIILPSSIHEVLMLADDHTHEYESLREMVRHINFESIPKEDILSDEIYLYRRSDHTIVRWTPCCCDNTDRYGTENL